MRALNDRQREILTWISDGSPSREWPDYSHRVTAKALQSRGLVRVRGRGPTWTAELTDLGRRYFAGELTPETPRNPKPPRRHHRAASRTTQPRSTSGPRITGGELLDQLVAAGGSLTIADPAEGTRAAYRRALATVPHDELPDGQRVTYRGRNRGDLVIRLVAKAEPIEPDPPVPVPDTIDHGHPVIRHLTRDPEAMAVSDATKERALLLMQAVVDECGRRGHKVQARAEGPGVEIVVGDDTIPVVIAEEKAKVSRIPQEEIAELKYDWQRARPVTVEDWNGRLVMSIDLEQKWTGNPWWADRKRWTLDSRLPKVLRAVEELAAQRTEARQRAEEERQARRKVWEEAVPKARQAYLDEVNRRRLTTQLEARQKADDMRDYADNVRERARAMNDRPSREAALAWAAWIREEASRVDPTSETAALRYVVPEEIPSWELDMFMPKGMTVRHPPD